MWGTDFSHVFAKETFLLMDRLIEKLENMPEPFKTVKLRYSTVSEYFNTV